jgi:post-segregation antitoxin (ccd killing protein)
MYKIRLRQGGREKQERVGCFLGMQSVHTLNHCLGPMRISATIPDEVGEAVKAETDNVSAFVADALEEKLARIRRRRAREEILDAAGTGGVSPDFDDELRQMRQRSD